MVRKLILGVGSGIFYSILSICVALITTPYFLNFMSKEEFGVYFLINNLIIWSGLLNLGLRGSFKLQLSTAIGKGEETKFLISTTFYSQCVVAISILCIGFIGSFISPLLLEKLFNLIGKDLHVLIILLCSSFALSLVSNPLITILSVYNRNTLIYNLRSVLLIVQALFSVLLLKEGLGIKGLAIAAFFSEIIFLVCAYLYFKKKLPFVKLQKSSFDIKLLRKSLSLGKWFLVGFLAQLFIKHTDLFLIEKFAGLETITSFIFSSKLYFISSSILVIIIKIVSPQLTKLIQSDTIQSSQNDYLMVFIKSVIGFILTSGIFIYFINGHFISLWVGKSFYLGRDINFMLLIIYYFGSFNLGIRAVLMAHTEFKSQKTAALIEGILHVGLSIVLGYLFNLQGIIIGILISTVVSCFINYSLLLSNNLFSKESKRELLLLSIYVFLISGSLLVFPSSSIVIDMVYLGVFICTYYFISQAEVQWIYKSSRAK